MGKRSLMQRHVKQSDAGAKLDGQPSKPFAEQPEEVAAPVDAPTKLKRKPRASARLGGWLTERHAA